MLTILVMSPISIQGMMESALANLERGRASHGHGHGHGHHGGGGGHRHSSHHHHTSHHHHVRPINSHTLF